MTAMDRQVADTASRMVTPADVALTVGAWLGVTAFGLLCGLAGFMAVTR